jgi:hypothetical protein
MRNDPAGTGIIRIPTELLAAWLGGQNTGKPIQSHKAAKNSGRSVRIRLF